VRGTTRELLSVIGVLIGAFLVLEHSTGFSRDVGAISTGGVGVIKTLQGR
jgi:quinol-cytochrome oxidoreductase complex cytochrome b subunit